MKDIEEFVSIDLKIENYQTRLETMLSYSLGVANSEVHVTGTSSPLAVSWLLSQSNSREFNNLPRLVVVSSLKEAESLKEQIQFFDPTRRAVVCGEFDVSPYSGLYPNKQGPFQRLNFLHKALAAAPGDIFICSSAALLQKTMPAEIFKKFTKTFSVGDELPSNLSEFFADHGYQSVPMVEDKGSFAIRGGIVDVYPPNEAFPIRIELFGDQIDSIRTFRIDDQRSLTEQKSFNLAPASEILFRDEQLETAIKKFRVIAENQDVDKIDLDETVRSIALKNYFPGVEFLLPCFYSELSNITDYFKSKLYVIFLDPEEITRGADELWATLKEDYKTSLATLFHPTQDSLFTPIEKVQYPKDSHEIFFSSLEEMNESNSPESVVEYKTYLMNEFSASLQALQFGTDEWVNEFKKKISRFTNEDYKVVIAAGHSASMEKIKIALSRGGFEYTTASHNEYLWDTWFHGSTKIVVVPRSLNESIRLDEEKIVFLKEAEIVGKKSRSHTATASEEFQKQAKRLSFGDLKIGDLVVHTKHGIGQYDGLKLMNVGGVESEYVQVGYKDKDKLYLPVYRVGQLQKFSGSAATGLLDKLGGVGWSKTVSKVKGHVRDIAAELLRLYAIRSELHRPAFIIDEKDTIRFENGFPYEETGDQLRSIQDIRKDLTSTKPMDRLVCGDVGFGKTEVAMRAMFFAAHAGKQVALLAPTTVLTFQHYETLKHRFKDWPFQIRVLNRFVSNAEVKKTLEEMKDGKIDIVVGTHKLLGSTIEFKNLGLLIIDEEQKFGVIHKEKMKKMKHSVDTLTLSATPIPRTLDMSLVGIRDMSLINTAPVDRLPTRTFVTKWDDETIRKAIKAEVSRGGQVYFIHNRIEGIYGIADELRKLIPDIRMKVAHGQMEEHELEKAMLAFFNHEIDMLVCTAIVESGMDVPRANTMFIDSAHMFGLSQLYQLRGRVGRSKTRAYCYLVLPRNKKLDKEQQERLKVIQDNTALGSGLKIAQYDLELRGAGNILGDEQSGHINTVGYEMYMDLLGDALAEARGEEAPDKDLDPEINLRVPAMIPDNYIKDIRIRLGYYKALADIESENDLTRIEDELKDQFGPLPDATVNLMGLMLIRKQCKELGVRDISAGVKSISLIVTERTKLQPTAVIRLCTQNAKKYSITPDNRLNVKLDSISWGTVYEELNQLLTLV